MRDTPGCMRHKRRRREAEGVQQPADGAPLKEWHDLPQGRIPPARVAEAAGEAAAHDLTVSYRGGRDTGMVTPQWGCVERSLGIYPRDTTQPISTYMPR
jgi:hypothetical protein